MPHIDLDETKSIILDYIRKEFLDEEEMDLNYDTPLISSGYVDSFSMVSLLVFLERRFNIKIPPAKATAEAFDNVNKIVYLIKRYFK